MSLPDDDDDDDDDDDQVDVDDHDDDHDNDQDDDDDDSRCCRRAMLMHAWFRSPVHPTCRSLSPAGADVLATPLLLRMVQLTSRVCWCWAGVLHVGCLSVDVCLFVCVRACVYVCACVGCIRGLLPCDDYNWTPRLPHDHHADLC